MHTWGIVITRMKMPYIENPDFREKALAAAETLMKRNKKHFDYYTLGGIKSEGTIAYVPIWLVTPDGKFRKRGYPGAAEADGSYVSGKEYDESHQLSEKEYDKKGGFLLERWNRTVFRLMSRWAGNVMVEGDIHT